MTAIGGESLTLASLAATIGPQIESTTADYLDEDRPHPYLSDLRTGGLVIAASDQDPSGYQEATIVEASALRVDSMTRLYRDIGYPDEIIQRGVVWNVESARYGIIDSAGREPKILEHQQQTQSYWDPDQEVWVTKRRNDNSLMDGYIWQEQWDDSELGDVELNALKSTAAQLRTIYQIYNACGNGPISEFIKVLFGTTKDRKRLELLALGLQSPVNISTPDNASHPLTRYPWMRLYNTAFQNLPHLLDAADHIVDYARSDRVSSAASHIALMYCSPPFTDEMTLPLYNFAESGERLPTPLPLDY